MKIAIIGSGNIGGNLGRLWRKAGHEVVFGSRDPQKISEFAASSGATTDAVDAAAASGKVVVLATPWRNPEALPSPQSVAGKITIDTMNPYTPAFTIFDLGDSTSSEETLKRLPGARLVKAFNTIPSARLANEGNTALALDERLVIPIAGDDADAKAVVAKLIDELGFGAIDWGNLHDGGKAQEPGTPVYGAPLTVAQARALRSQ